MAGGIIEKILKDPELKDSIMSSNHFVRFMKHFPFKGDDELVVLKGHLLIEELLWVFVLDNVSNKEALKKVQDDPSFGFENLTHLAEALNQRERLGWLWSAIIKLNRIRNGFAHKLEPKGIDDKKKDFIEYVQTNDAAPWIDIYIEEFGKLSMAIWGCHKYLQLLVQYESIMKVTKKSIKHNLKKKER